MKLIASIILFFTITLISAQSNEVLSVKNTSNDTLNSKKDKSIEKTKAFVISVKGVKKIEDLDIENFNKNSFFNLIASKKRKNNIC